LDDVVSFRLVGDSFLLLPSLVWWWSFVVSWPGILFKAKIYFISLSLFV